MLANCRVVLVRPEFAGNLGATARVMRNFGLRQLVLVNPVADPGDPKAHWLATHAEEILDNASRVDDLGSAVSDCLLVIGTSARAEGIVRGLAAGLPEQIIPRVVACLAQGPVALVFGPESTGLTNDEVTCCHHLIRIPADPACPVLNLAQAVAICLYELWRAVTPPLTHSLKGGGNAEPLVAMAEQERMFEHLRRGLEAIHFLYDDRADGLMHAIRHLIGRAGLTQKEIGILHGLARQMEHIAKIDQ